MGTLLLEVTVRAPQPGVAPALSPPAFPHPGQQNQTSGEKSQVTPMLLTRQVLLPSPSYKLAVHSAFVQDPIHSQDVHLSLWDGPGPKSGTPLPPLSLDAHRHPEPGHGLKVPSAQGVIPHLGLGMPASSLYERRAEPDSPCRSPLSQGPRKGRLLTGRLACA